MASNYDFTEGEGLKLQVKKFCKCVKIGRRGEQFSVTQTNHRQVLWAKPQAAGQLFVIFWKKQLFQCHLDHILHVFRAKSAETRGRGGWREYIPPII